MTFGWFSFSNLERFSLAIFLFTPKPIPTVFFFESIPQSFSPKIQKIDTDLMEFEDGQPEELDSSSQATEPENEQSVVLKIESDGSVDPQLDTQAAQADNDDVDNDDIDEEDEEEDDDVQTEETNSFLLTNFDIEALKGRIMDLDDQLDDVLGSAASSFWGFATSNLESVTKQVSKAAESTPLKGAHFDVNALKESIASMRQKMVAESQSMEKAIIDASKAKEPRKHTETTSSTAMKSPSRPPHPDDVSSDRKAISPIVVASTSNPSPKSSSWAMPSLVSSFWNAVKQDESVRNFMGAGRGVAASSAMHLATTSPRSGNTSANRFQLKLKAIQADPDVYCNPTKDFQAFETWAKDFPWQARKPEQEAIFKENLEIKNLFYRMVPQYIEESTFWLRYFFAVHQLEQEEQKRLQLLSKVGSNREEEKEEALGWSDDEDDQDIQDGPQDNGQKIVDKEDKGCKPSMDVTGSMNKDTPATSVGSTDPDAAPEQDGPEVKPESHSQSIQEISMGNNEEAIPTDMTGRDGDLKDQEGAQIIKNTYNDMHGTTGVESVATGEDAKAKNDDENGDGSDWGDDWE